MGAPLAVAIREVVDPAVMLTGAVGQLNAQRVFWGEFEESLEVLPQVGGAAPLEGQHVGPVILFTDIQHGAAGEKRIPANAQAGLRKVSLKCGGESVAPRAPFELAILFDFFVPRECGWLGAMGMGRRDLCGRILDELGAYGQGETAGGDQLGLQEGMQIKSVVPPPTAGCVRHFSQWRLWNSRKLAPSMAATKRPRRRKASRAFIPAVGGAHAPSSELGEGLGADMTQKVVEGFVDGERVLLGASQAIGIVKYLELQISQLVVQSAAAA